MKKIAMLILVLCLLLSGCDYWNRGSYSSVKPHTDSVNQGEKTIIPVYKYEDLTEALASIVESGAESGIVSMQYGSGEERAAEFEKAIREVQGTNPFAAYAVDDISYAFEEGKNRSVVRISYLPDRVQTSQILRVQTIDEVREIIGAQLDICSSGVVLYFDTPEQVDYAGFVETYSLENPKTVMEMPVVTVDLYPEQGQQQIVALEFTYQTSYAEMRSLQNKVEPVFSAAQQYVAGNWSAAEKSLRLYTFLMTRYDYNIQSSITPAYSLLLYGQGDCKAFAMVYGAMCKQAGVDCRVVVGTRNGKPWVWNAVKLDGKIYYLDLLQCNESGVFALYEADQMKGYAWERSSYLT